MSDEELIDDQGVKQLIAAKRFKILKALLEQLLLEAQKDKADKGLVGVQDAIEGIASTVETFVGVVKSLPKPEAPVISVQTNQELVVTSLLQIGTAITNEITRLRDSLQNHTDDKPLVDKYEWSFQRNAETDLIEKVTAAVIYK